MAITVSRAGKLITDSEGYVKGRLLSIVILKETETNKDIELEWKFEVDTTKGKTDKYLWTGINVNDQKTYFSVDDNGIRAKEGDYNRLTQVLLSLGLIDKEQLESQENSDLDLEPLIGRWFKFQVKPSRRKPGLSEIDLKNIRFSDELDDPQKKS